MRGKKQTKPKTSITETYSVAVKVPEDPQQRNPLLLDQKLNDMKICSKNTISKNNKRSR